MVALYRRNKISKAAKLAWPGNDIPMFRGNQANQTKLSSLVSELRETCTSKHFFEDRIRQHIIDSMHERRRAVGCKQWI